MNQTEEKIMAAVREDHAYVVRLRRYLHMHPELSGQEEHTAQKIEQELDQIGLPHHRIGEHSVYAQLTGTQPGSKVIVLRADIDALPIQEEHACDYQSQTPGVMHACGHDAHVAGLIGAARVLQKNRDCFGGTVRFVFQEKEENGHGAMAIVNSDALDGADRTFGLHMAPNVPVGSIVVMPGPNNASVDLFRIHVTGKSAHVSTPEQGVDALYIAAQIIVSLQAIVTRRMNPMATVLIGVGTVTAGTAYNIVAQTAEIQGTIRAFSPTVRTFVKQQLSSLAAATAGMYGGQAEVEYVDNGSPLINDAAASAQAQQTATALFGRDHVITSRTPSMAGDDMADLILKVPGVYAYVGSANPQRPETQAPQHNSHFDIDEDAMLVSAAIHAAYAADFLNDSFAGGN